MAEWWSVDLLDGQDYRKAQLSTVRTGKLNWSIFRAVQGVGSLEVTADPAVTPNWLTDRVKIWHHLDGRDPKPHGIWLCNRPSRSVDGDVARYTLGLVDKTHLLNQKTGRWLTYDAGSVVVPLVRGIITSRGETAAIADSTETLRAPLSFEPSDTWLTIVNALLDALGYAAVAANLDGVLASSPYVAPEDREPAGQYGPGAWKMLPQFDDDLNLAEIPNVTYINSPGDETTPGLIGRASNDNPADPLSTANRPEVVLSEQAEATSQEAIDAIAVKRLAESQQATRRATITHPVDASQLNSVVTHPAGFAGAIVERTIQLDIGAVVDDTVRRIYTAKEGLPWP